jgi:hypothetical protein
MEKLFPTAAACRNHLIEQGYNLIPYKWWQNDNVNGENSCLSFCKTYHGQYKIYPA